MFSFKELIDAYKQIDTFNEHYDGKYRMSCNSDSKGLHITVVDFALEKVYSWQPFQDNEELHDFILETCW